VIVTARFLRRAVTLKAFARRYKYQQAIESNRRFSMAPPAILGNQTLFACVL